MEMLVKKVLRRVKRIIRSLCDRNCHLPHTFSQGGEDLILSQVFERKTEGFYVDVGAHHPIRYSNTNLFYQRGWRGINIDAMPGSMEAFRDLRARDINIERAIGENPGGLPFYIFNEPTLNTFDSELAKERDGMEHFRLVDTRIVEIHTLARILEEWMPAGKSIDFLSVDAEGFDLSVLRSNDWKRFPAQCVLAEGCLRETIEESLQAPIANFLRSVGYALFAKTLHTQIYKRL